MYAKPYLKTPSLCGKTISEVRSINGFAKILTVFLFVDCCSRCFSLLADLQSLQTSPEFFVMEVNKDRAFYRALTSLAYALQM